MRLSKLKLIGFKSFVDPTTIAFPSNRVGVVGPNGCGKSNVIDAVRWVMGESSAKNLRGSAMTDVIFNGSATRKPVEQAAIELIFEEVNLPQYPEHAEIAVKRQIGRDGQSEYFLNGIRCRRKDITDLFLGTGLGPRSYAIIEQGTISRLIEAKPEELRIFLEEAAGISKYKERRKETEQRMQQSRDNLARLDEVRNELQKQLEKLQKQAKEAEKYQQLKQSEYLLKAQLLAIRWNTLDAAVQNQEQRITEQAAELETDLLTLHNLENTHKQRREARTAAQAILNTVQERFYELDNEVKRLQQSIEHATERQEQSQWDLQQLQESWEEANRQLETDEQQLTELTEESQSAGVELQALQIAATQAEHALHAAEQQAQTWQVTWEKFNKHAAEPTQRAQVERAHLQNLEQRLTQAQHRLFKLEEEKRELTLQAAEQAKVNLESALNELKATLAETETTLITQQQVVQQSREETQHASTRLHEQQIQVNQLSGRLASLETLQEAALGKSSADVNAWLHAHGLRDVPRLAQSLQVESNWELAVETVLGSALQALCVENLQILQTALTRPPQGHISIVSHDVLIAFPSTGSGNESRTSTSSGNELQKRCVPITQKLRTQLPLTNLLAGIWAADSLEIAYELRSYLAAHESLITPQGIWLGINWLHSQQGSDEKAGVLAREQEVKRVAAQLQHLDKTVLSLTSELAQKRLNLQTQETQYHQAQLQVNELRQQLSQLQSQQGGIQARVEHTQLRIQRITEEHIELLEQISNDNDALTACRKQLHAALATMEKLADEREQLTQQRDSYQAKVIEARQTWQRAKEACHQVEIRLESLRTDKARLQQGMARLQARVQQLGEQRYELQQNLEKQGDPLDDWQSELADYEQQRSTVEESLLQAKQTVANLETALSQYEEERHTLETRSSGLRSALEHARMECQANQVRRQTVEEQLAETEFSAVALLAELPEYADEPSWQSQIEAVERKLQRLGSVNLAALEEYAEQSARKSYLDEQAADLNSALTQLANAIHTIDREMRLRFKQTLDSVNKSLQVLFPRLLGGGQAYLEMTSDDVLKAGVAIMARPPGKRNSSIHLLSGGEKALTAIALVFGIFELNPAPFCMLDEVDAPLDDTNVGRFCALVKMMSERVQFIFISHNKITMEIADQLIGVTMQEPGVSRPVSVDIEMAMNLVTA